MKRILITTFVVASAISAPAMAANNLDQLNLLASQKEFRELSEDLGSALSFKGIIPATPLGITGFDVGIEATGTKLEHKDIWEKVSSSNNVPGTVYAPKLHVTKGLPFGIDVGAFYASVPNTDVKLTGAELRYALVEGGVATPALGLRAAYTKLSGVDQLEFSTKSVELLLSKGITVVTPYAGIGKVWTDSKPMDIPGLKEEKFSQSKYLVGVNLNFGVFNVAVEGDRTGDATSYSLKVGLRF